jgi:prophage regulatory protein
MFLTVPGDVVAMPSRRHCEHRRGATDVMATAQRGELANVAQPLPAPCFEESCAGMRLSRVINIDSRRHAAVPAPAMLRVIDGDRIVRMPEAVRRSGLSRATIYRRIPVGGFPPAVSLGGKCIGFRESEICAWIASRGQGGAA